MDREKNTNINIHAAQIMSYQVFVRSYYAKRKGLVDYQGREWLAELLHPEELQIALCIFWDVICLIH